MPVWKPAPALPFPFVSSNAFALFLFFTGVSVACGVAAAALLGPRRRTAVVLPVLAAFLALYVIGHRSGLEIGPSVTLFGFDVRLAFDLAVAIAAAGVTALAQRMVLERRAQRGQR